MVKIFEMLIINRDFHKRRCIWSLKYLSLFLKGSSSKILTIKTVWCHVYEGIMLKATAAKVSAFRQKICWTIVWTTVCSLLNTVVLWYQGISQKVLPKFDISFYSSIHLVWRLISTLIKLEISTLLKTITNSCFQALERLKFQALEGLKFQALEGLKSNAQPDESNFNHFLVFFNFLSRAQY